MQKIRYVHPEGELINAHSTFIGPQSACIITFIISLLIMLAILTTPTEWDKFPEDNWENKTWLKYATEVVKSDDIWMIDREGRNATYNKKTFLQDQFNKNLGMKRIYWGTTFNTYCWDDNPFPTKNESYTKLISIFRMFEFRPLPQALTRFIIMMLLSIRMIITIMRIGWVLVLNKKKKSLSFKVLCLILPIIIIFESISLFLFSSFHTDIDIELKFLIPYTLKSFGILCCIQMISNIIIDMNDEQLEISSTIFFIRFSCFLTFLPSFYKSYLSYMIFYEHKTCHPFVIWSDAINEYLVIISIFIYHLTTYFDFKNTIFVITPSYNDVVLDINEKYKTIYSPLWYEMQKCIIPSELKYFSKLSY